MKGSDLIDHGVYFCYNLLLLVFFPFGMVFFSWRYLVQVSYRRGAIERFGFLPQGIGKRETGQRLLWFHAVSVGEVLASVPLIREIKQRYPRDRLILSTVTVTGREVARQKLPEADALIFCPFDLPWITQRVVKQLEPSLFIFVETELWPNLLRSLRQGGVPSLMVNGRISPRSFRQYRWVRWFFRRVLRQINGFSVQTERDRRFLLELGADPRTVECTGNMKYDQECKEIGEGELNALRGELGVGKEDLVVVVGSTHEGEEERLLTSFDAMCKLWGPFLMIIAPRHLERLPSIEKLLDQNRIPFYRKSQLVVLRRQGEKGLDPGSVILLDTLGELVYYYSLATVVFVGGSLVPVGGHNILEPAAYGKVSFFGPHMENFAEVSRLMKARGGGIEVADVEELVSVVGRLLKDPEEIERRGREALQVVMENRGAVARNMILIDRFMQG